MLLAKYTRTVINIGLLLCLWCVGRYANSQYGHWRRQAGYQDFLHQQQNNDPRYRDMSSAQLQL